MEYALVWTPEAHDTLAQIVSYLDASNPSAGDTLLIQVDKSLALIARMPYMHAAVPEKPGLRRCVVDRHTALYYRVAGEQVELLSFFDTRQDPSKRKL